MLPRMVDEEEMDRIFEEKLFISRRGAGNDQDARSSTFPSSYSGNNNMTRKMVNAIMDENTDYNYGKDSGKEFSGKIDLRGMSYDYDTDRIVTEDKQPSTVTFGETPAEDVVLGTGKAIEECDEKVMKESKGYRHEENVALCENEGEFSHTEMIKNKVRKVPLREIDSNVLRKEGKWKGGDGDVSLKKDTKSSLDSVHPEDNDKKEPVPFIIQSEKITKDPTPVYVNKVDSCYRDSEQQPGDDREWGRLSDEEGSAGYYNNPVIMRNGRNRAEQEKQLSEKTEHRRQKVVMIDDVPEVKFLNKNPDNTNMKSEHIRKIEEEFDRFRRVHIESLKFKSKIYKFIYQELYKMEENMGQRLTELEKENAQLKERIMYLEDHHKRFREFVSKGARIWKEQVIEGIREYKKRLDEEYERKLRTAENVLKQRKEAG